LNRLVPRWCCIDLLNAPRLPGPEAITSGLPVIEHSGVVVPGLANFL